MKFIKKQSELGNFASIFQLYPIFSDFNEYELARTSKPLHVFPFSTFLPFSLSFPLSFANFTDLLITYINTEYTQYFCKLYEKIWKAETLAELRQHNNTILLIEILRYINRTKNGKYGTKLWNFFILEMILRRAIAQIKGKGKQTSQQTRCFKLVK